MAYTTAEAKSKLDTVLNEVVAKKERVALNRWSILKERKRDYN
jgi:hypothetical protein